MSNCKRLACLVILCSVLLLSGCGSGQKQPLHAAGPDLSPIWVRWGHTVTVGHSVQGSPIWMYTFGHGPRHILIFAAIHGDEWTAYSIARNFTQLLEDQPDLYTGKTIYIIPAANPDALVANTRTNSHNVDVNRNFPTQNWEPSNGDSLGGESAASEPETHAVMRAVEISTPERIVSIHSMRNGKHGNNFNGPAQTIVEAMAAKNGYKVLPDIGYPTPGSFGTWAGNEQQIPTITLELPRAAGPEQCWAENKDTLLAAIE